jgi:hypothetical protein
MKPLDLCFFGSGEVSVEQVAMVLADGCRIVVVADHPSSRFVLLWRLRTLA